MSKTSKQGSFRAAVLRSAAQDRSKSSSYGHLLLPRGVSAFKEEAGGRISLDIIPYAVADDHHPDRDQEFGRAVKGSLWYRRPYKLHRSIGLSNASVVCPAGAGRKCPICEYREKMVRDDKRDWKDPAVRALRAGDRNLYYVVPKGSSRHDEVPYLWDISRFAFQDMLNAELDEDEEHGDFLELDGGLTLRIRFSDERLETTSWAKTSRIDFDRRNYNYDEDLIRGLASLDAVPDLKSYQEIERMFYESGDDGEATARQGDSDGSADPAVEAPPKTTAAGPTRSWPKSDAAAPSSGNAPAAAPRQSPDARPAAPPSRRSAGNKNSPQNETAPAAGHTQPARVAAAAAESDESRTGEIGECPSGFVFGVDIDQHDECDKCPVWHPCMDASEARTAR